MQIYIFCSKNKIKDTAIDCLYFGNFVYPFILLDSSKISSFLNKNMAEYNYINRIEILDSYDEIEYGDLCKETILKYFINSINLNISILTKTITNYWDQVKKYPNLFKNIEENLEEQYIDVELIQHEKMISDVSKLFYDLETVERSLNEIDFTLNRLTTLTKSNNIYMDYLDDLDELNFEHQRIRNEFNKLENIISALINVKNWQIEAQTSRATQLKMNTIININAKQHEMMIKSAEASSKTEVLEVTIAWLALLQLYYIFSDSINSFFVSNGFNLILSQIFISIFIFWLTLLIVKAGNIFVKRERSKRKDEIIMV